jgi:hypothetical protein
MCDVQLWIGNTFIDPLTAPEAQIRIATSASLVFTTQKNGVCGEVVNHACSGATHCRPVHHLARCIIHLQQHTGSSIIQIASYYHNNRKRAVKTQDITSVLRQAVRLIGPDIGICEDDM